MSASVSDDFPSRSEDGLAALDIFYNEFNDIHFYVEDADQENLYFVLLKRLLPGIRIERIFPLGGKGAVIRHAEACVGSTPSQFAVHLLDRDFDHLLGTQSSLPSIFYLDRFCIENHLLEECAVVEFVVESHPKEKRDDIANRLNLPSYLQRTFSDLRTLFIYFACVQRFCINLQNCKSPPERYCHPRRRWEVNPDSVTAYRQAIVAETQALNLPISDPASDERLADVSALADHELVSGKHVAAMLFHYVKSKYSVGSITFESFLYRLAKNCELMSLAQLTKRIEDSHNDFRTTAKAQRRLTPRSS